MECIHGRVSYASWRLTVFRRLFLSSDSTGGNAKQRISRRTISNTTDPKSKPQSKEPDENDEIPQEPLRPSQLLPQSPLMRTLHPGLDKKRKKRLPTRDDLSDLSRNPWAMALASPPRMCAVTGIRVPKDFMTDWGLVHRPDPEAYWFMPVGAMKDQLGPRDEAKPPPVCPPGTHVKLQQSSRHLTLRMVDRLPLVRQLTKRAAPAGVGRKSPVVRLFPQRWKYPNGPYTGREEKMIVWRNDMPEFMLARLRSEAIKLIKSASDAFKRSDVPNGVWTSVDMEEYSEAALDEGLDYLEPIAHMGRGAVLVLGERQPDHDVKAESQGSSTDIALQESDVEEVESGSQDSSTDKPLQEGGSVEAVPESQDPSTDTELQEGSPEEARSELQDTEVNLDSTDAVCVSDALPEYVTLPQTQSKVPVFELLELFSDEEMDELRSYHPRFNSPALFFRPTDKLTVNTMLALWKLKGYIRQDNAST